MQRSFQHGLAHLACSINLMYVRILGSVLRQDIISSDAFSFVAKRVEEESAEKNH